MTLPSREWEGGIEKVCVRRGQRQEVETVVRRSRDGQQVRRGQALMWLDSEEGVGAVLARLGMARQAAWHARWQRSQGWSLGQVLTDSPRTGGDRPSGPGSRTSSSGSGSGRGDWSLMGITF